ncbi:MAG: HAD family hydrolase [Ruminococcaceae bacterium]|nr:HAD family hydrolase [Oscillospiraceae bacterium]
MKYKTVIWDFNGTLLSDMGISMEAMNCVLERRDLPKISSLSEFQRVFGFPVEDYYRRLGLDFSKEPYKVPADEWIELYNEKMYTSPLTEGAADALEKIKKSNIRQIVLSASEKAKLTDHLEKLGIAHYFDEIHGAEDVYAKGKAEIARELSKREELFPAVLVGDTDHDYLCARAMGCDCILFCGGFMSKERLSVLGAPVSDSITEIAREIIS